MTLHTPQEQISRDVQALKGNFFVEFFPNKSDVSQQEKERLWSLYVHHDLTTALEASTATECYTSDANGPHGGMDRNVSVSLSQLGPWPKNMGLYGPGNASQQSTISAVTMTRHRSHAASVPGRFPVSPTAALDIPAPNTKGFDVECWRANNAPYNPYQATESLGRVQVAPLHSPLEQLDEGNAINFESPSDFLSRQNDVDMDGQGSHPFSTQQLTVPRNSSFWAASDPSHDERGYSQASFNSIDIVSGAALTSGTTAGSDLSRVQSSVDSAMYAFFEKSAFEAASMPSFNSTAQTSPLEGVETFPITKALHSTFSGEQLSDDLRGVTGGAADASSLAPDNDDADDMQRSGSNNSTSSGRSALRSSQRRRELLANQRRTIMPKSSTAASTSILSRRLAEGGVALLRSKSDNGQRLPISKPRYLRRPGPRVMCESCNEHPQGFRGEHELKRHTDHFHRTTRIMWQCVDASKDKKFLADCKACRSGKKYGAYYNAAAHLRRSHFSSRKRSSDQATESIPMPSMQAFKDHWLVEVEQVVSSLNNNPSLGDDSNDRSAILEGDSTSFLSYPLPEDTSLSYIDTSTFDNTFELLAAEDSKLYHSNASVPAYLSGSTSYIPVGGFNAPTESTTLSETFPTIMANDANDASFAHPSVFADQPADLEEMFAMDLQ